MNKKYVSEKEKHMYVVLRMKEQKSDFFVLLIYKFNERYIKMQWKNIAKMI